jgi:energy-coupling factor transporter ATP-binding protein EcfA2
MTPLEISARGSAPRPGQKGEDVNRPNGHLMIEHIDIRNFRCFEHLQVPDCKRINVIVGDNGGGKTALLEAIFLAIATGTEIAVRFRQQRGLEFNFTGAPRAIEEAIFGDLFFDRDFKRTVSVVLSGFGPEARSLRIYRGAGSSLEPSSILPINMAGFSSSSSLSFKFEWTDAQQQTRIVSPQVSPSGLQVGGTGEDLPGFFFFPSGQTVSAMETAQRFSELSRSRKEKSFIDFFCNQYEWIENLSLEIVGGSAALHATVRGLHEKVPVANVGGAINRLIAVMLSISTQPQGVVLVDEMENGVYHEHHTAVWRSILSLARQQQCQLFTTTHNEEWLEALMEAAGEQVSDLALWRLERIKGRPVLRQFFGKTFKGSIEAGGEVR